MTDLSTPKIPLDIQDLDVYKKALFKMLESKVNTYFPNDSEQHAAIVYEVFLTNAQKTVNIFCNSLKKSVFGCQDVVTALNAAFKRGVTVNIVSEFNPEESDFLIAVKKAKSLGLASIKTFNSNKTDFNFCVVDEVSFRWEKDNSQPRAVCSMYNPKQARILTDYFNQKLLKAPGLISVD